MQAELGVVGAQRKGAGAATGWGLTMAMAMARPGGISAAEVHWLLPAANRVLQRAHPEQQHQPAQALSRKCSAVRTCQNNGPPLRHMLQKEDSF